LTTHLAIEREVGIFDLQGSMQMPYTMPSTNQVSKWTPMEMVIFALRFVALGLVHFGAGEAGRFFISYTNGHNPAWFTSGVAIAGLTLWGWRLWPAVGLGTLASLLMYQLSWPSMLMIALGNILEALAGAYLLRRLVRWRSQFDIQSDAISIGVVSLLATPIGASFGTFALMGADSQNTPYSIEIFHRTWLAWWTACSLGSILLIPFLISLARIRWSRLDRGAFEQFLRFLSVSLCVSALFYLIFREKTGLATSILTFPTLFLGAFYLRPLGLRLLVLLIATAAIAATFTGVGPFWGESLSENIVYLQLFLTAIAITALFLEGFSRAGHFWVPALSLTVGWLLTTILFHSFDLNKRARDQAHFNTIVEDVTDRMTARMAVLEDALRAGVSFYVGSYSVEKDEWRRFVGTLRISKQYGDIDSLGIVLQVNSHEVPKFRNNIAKLGIRDVKIRPIRNSPPHLHESSLHSVVILAEPETSESPVGLDLSTEPIRQAALAQSHHSGMLVATEGLKYMDEIANGPGFILFHPIGSHFAPQDRQSEQSPEFQGWVYLPVLAHKFFAGLRGRFWSEIEIYVFDDPRATPESLLFRSNEEKEDTIEFESLTKIQLAQRSFYIGWKKGRGFVSENDASEAWVGFGGAMLSLLFAAMLVGLRETNERATSRYFT